MGCRGRLSQKKKKERIHEVGEEERKGEGRKGEGSGRQKRRDAFLPEEV